MNKQSPIKEYIGYIINTVRFAVLATEFDGQPHTSKIAITPFGSIRQMIFATYRNTRKFRNLENNNKVAVFIEGEYVNMNGLKESVVLTIIGYTEQISMAENEAASDAHLKRHPEMKSFILSSDCALIKVIAQSFQVVNGVDEIRWFTAENLFAL